MISRADDAERQRGDAERDGQEREADVERAVAEHALQVQRAEEEHAEHPGDHAASARGSRVVALRARKIRSGTSGCAAVASRATKPASRATATAPRPSVSAEPQPLFGTSTIV